MFSHNFGMEKLMVQSVFNEHQYMFIKFNLFSVDLCVFLIFHYRQVSLAGCGSAPSRKVLRFESSYARAMAGLRRAATEPVVRLLFAAKVDVITSTSVVTRMWRLASWRHKVTRRWSVRLPLSRSSVIRWRQQVTRMWRHPSHVRSRQYQVHRGWTQSTRWWLYVSVGKCGSFELLR